MGRCLISLDNVVILVNGEFPEHQIPLNILSQSKNLICCDGAVNKLDEIGLIPNKIIGDMDSINHTLKIKYAEKLIQFDRQTDTDLEKALKFCIDSNYKSVKIIGISGERDDHFLSNIFLCWNFSNQINIEMFSNFGEFNFIFGTKNFNSFKGQQISIFSQSKTNKITTSGLKYHLKNESLSYLYSGISNESIGDVFSIKVSNESLMIYKLFKG